MATATDALHRLRAAVATGELDDLATTSASAPRGLRGAGPVLRARALGPDSAPLFEAVPGLFATAQMAALTEAMETAPRRRRDLELLAER
jgi:hypothetical protein